MKELGFTKWCIKNSTSIYVITILICFAGFVAYNKTPKELFPDIVIPTVSIATIYPGASPQDIENLITKPIEKQLKSINGIKKISSNSVSDFSLVIAEFNTDQDPKVCKQRVSDAVDKAKKDLPNDLKDDPQVQEFDFSELPIMNINIAGDFPLDRIKNYSELLKDKIETLKEITRVDIVGGVEREIQVNVDMYRMNLSGVTFGDIEGALQRQNLNISGGELKIQDLRRNLRITGEFNKPTDIENIVVRSFTGTQVFIKDIAEVKDNFKEKQDFARLDDKAVLTLNVIKRSGENLINATDKIYQIIEDFKKNKFPEGITVKVTGDTSDKSRVQLHDLINTVILGFIFVVFVLMFFMGFTNAFFVGLAVPLSCLVAFLVMPVFDMSMNVIVLFSFLLALGIIVDDAIVVIENTHRIFNKYKDLTIQKAANLAAGEVFIPVLTGTLTTLMPFVPLLFWPGIIGKFMSNLPVTLIITLGASLFVAFVMNPVFAVSFMTRDETNKKSTLMSYKGSFIFLICTALVGYFGLGKGLGNFAILCIILILLYHFILERVIVLFQEKLWPVVINSYKKTLVLFIKGWRPVFIVLGVFAFLIISWVGYLSTNPPIETFPNGEPNFAFVYCKMPMGTDATVTDSVTKIIEERVLKTIGHNNPIVTSVISNVGLGAGDPDNPDRVATPHKSKVSVAFVRFAERNGKSTTEILKSLKDEFKHGIAGAEITVEKERNGPPVGKAINMEISGDDFDVLVNLSKQIKDEVESANIQGVDQLLSDFQISKPEIIIDIDEEKTQREGISVAQVAIEIRTALFGKEVSKFRDKNDDAPIQLRLREEDRNNVERMLNLNIAFMDMATQQFKQVPLSALTKVRYGNSVSTINRKNQKRLINLSSDVNPGFNPNDVVAKIQTVVSQMDIPEGYEVDFTGELEQQKETMDFLSLAFGAALALMFLILVTQFNSVVKPFIIFSTVLFSLIGIALGFGIFKITLSVVMTGVGIFALAGIVVRNGILLLEFIDELRLRGMEVSEAVVEGGATRLTPVILTAISAILGLIPLAVGLNMDFGTLLTEFDAKFYLGGDNVVFWGPLAWTIIFGLIVSTFLTLLIVPTMYMLGYNTRAWFRKTFSR
ncbi:MAG: efflux RND transporter permease subunit [Saprospiraceae bacterium]|nr:efflux RND transporter permease subunit [Candidatus Vicinibacter affinis]MBK7693740.1 efflux RND transporter permease subunit [Candidatus Vicinibacter affinis]MBK7799387.1 efflux RND transporter permease subunit [Candidatus Vicinibacter affinis]